MSGPHKIREMMKSEQERAKRRFRRQKNQNLLAKPGIHDCVIVLDHLKPTYNVGKIFRSADAFGIREIHLIGIDFFDPASSMGAFKWVPAHFHKNFFQCYTKLITDRYTPFVLEPENGKVLPKTNLPKKSAFIFGHEGYGISFEPDLFPEVQRMSIPQFGKTQSLNVSIAASIIMYEYACQHAKL
jgi:tRNA G18 (ribose-2'-O)-methylase SpoU